MSKVKKVASVAFTGAAAAAAVGITATPAAASHGHWVISPGGAYSAFNTTVATLQANGVTLTCAAGAASASGSLSGTSQTAHVAQLGTIARADFGLGGGCTGFGVPTNAQLNQSATLWATGPTVGGITQGEVRDIDATVRIPLLGCVFTVSGTLPGYYSNASSKLVVNPGSSPVSGLHITDTNCSGLFPVNAPAWFQAEFTTSGQQVSYV